MNIALCLFGYPKGSTVYAGGAYQQKFKHLHEQVMIHNPDVFIHSWDVSLEDELNEIFKPKKYIFEKQKTFDDLISEVDVKRFLASRGDIFKTLSFFYTRYKSNELKCIQEEENGKLYDCVITSRFDVGYHNHGKNKTSYIDFNIKNDLNSIYSAYWDQINAGISDHWFYGNSKDIDTVCNIYKHTVNYLKEDSEYCTTMKNGWIDSDDNNEFSNEFLKNYKKTDNLKKYPDHYCLNNHCLYKWHFYQNDFWNLNKCKFLNKELWNV